MTDHSQPLQEAIYTALRADAGIKALVGDPARIYDNVPQQTTYPYITIGDDTAAEAGAADFDGQEITLTMHAWSQDRGRKEVKDILAAIYAALHDAVMAVTGATHVNLRWEFSDTFRDADGQTYHGVTRFRSYIHD